MYYVYILRSKTSVDKFYIGYTEHLDKRLLEHENTPPDAYTHRYAPWRLETYIVFPNKRLALEFESYLKSHSGRAFLRRRLMAAE